MRVAKEPRSVSRVAGRTPSGSVNVRGVLTSRENICSSRRSRDQRGGGCGAAADRADHRGSSRHVEVNTAMGSRRADRDTGGRSKVRQNGRVPRTLAVANQKGGVAKTTTVATLGAALAELGQRVLLVDLDPQACLTFSVGIDPEDLDKSIHHVLLGGVKARDVLVEFRDGPDLLPAAIELSTAEVKLARESGPEQVLRTALRPLRASYDWIIVDCPPTLGLLTVNGLSAAS